MGSFGVKRNNLESTKSLHLNCEQLTVISQSEQSLKKIEALKVPLFGVVNAIDRLDPEENLNEFLARPTLEVWDGATYWKID